MAAENSIRQNAISSIVIKFSSLPISKGIKELQDELLTTTNQLSDLINSRYQDFISLPDGLTGMDKVLEDIKLDHVEGDKLLGVGPNVASELRRRIELLDQEISRCKQSVTERRKIQKEIKILSYYMQLDQGRKRVQDLYDSLISLIESQHNHSSDDAVNSIVLGLDRVARELVYLSGNLDLAATSESDSTVIADIAKSVDKLKRALLDIVKDLLAKCMEKVGLYSDKDKPTGNVNTHLGILIRVCHELNSFNMVVEVFSLCLIEPFLLEMEIIKKNGSNFKDCLNMILQFANEKCKPIFTVSLKGSDDTSHSFAKSAGLLLVTGVWDKCIAWILKEFESCFLVSNSITTFHDNYSNFARFAQHFETLCLEVKQTDNFKSSPIFKEVNKKWQLSVYFQLCHNEIVEEFEACFSALSTAKEARTLIGTPHSAVNRAIDRFWGLEVAIRAISPRLWKSSLVVIHRYISWNTSNIPVSVESAVSSLTVPPEADVQLLANNYSNLSSNMVRIEKVLSEKIPLVLGVPVDNNQIWPVLKPALHEAFEIEACAGKMKNLLIESLACISYDVLASADKIPAQYRRTGKEVSTSPSYFISDCFAKSKELIQNHCMALDTVGRQDLLCQAAIKTIQLYSALVSKTLESVKKTEEALKKFKVRKQPSTAINSPNSMKEMRDEDKIRLQFSIDAEYFGKEVSKLGVDISTNEEFKLFSAIVAAATINNND